MSKSLDFSTVIITTKKLNATFTPQMKQSIMNFKDIETVMIEEMEAQFREILRRERNKKINQLLGLEEADI